MTELSIDAPSGEPLAAWLSPPRTDRGLELRRFELTSHGDRVGGRLWLPAAGSPPFPVLIALHELGRHACDTSLEQVAQTLARAGRAVAAIDLPLHGGRANTKLAGRAIAAGSLGPEAPPADARLWCELVAQAVNDCARTLDALLAEVPALDSRRVACVGFGIASAIGVIYSALDARIRAAAFVGARDAGPPAARPARLAARLAPRPVLFVNDTEGSPDERRAAEALHAAAREPKQSLWLAGAERAGSASALSHVSRFFDEALKSP